MKKSENIDKIDKNEDYCCKLCNTALLLVTHVQVVIANILQTRKKTVIMITPDDEVPIWMSDQELEYGKEIEEKIVGELYRHHLAMISGI